MTKADILDKIIKAIRVRSIIFLILMTMCATQVSGCTGNDRITSVSASRFEKELKADSVQLLDVRTPQEYAEEHIDGALNIDVQSDDFRQLAVEKLSKDSTILVYCRSGRRSMDAAAILTGLGYRVINLKGGIIEWKADDLPVTTESIGNHRK